jgi:hypothetical protein
VPFGDGLPFAVLFELGDVRRTALFLGPSIVVWGNGANSLVQHHTVTHLHLTKDYADLPLSNYVPVVLSSEYRSSQWTAAERMLSVTIEEPSES